MPSVFVRNDGLVQEPLETLQQAQASVCDQIPQNRMLEMPLAAVVIPARQHIGCAFIFNSMRRGPTRHNCAGGWRRQEVRSRQHPCKDRGLPPTHEDGVYVAHSCPGMVVGKAGSRFTHAFAEKKWGQHQRPCEQRNTGQGISKLATFSPEVQ